MFRGKGVNLPFACLEFEIFEIAKIKQPALKKPPGKGGGLRLDQHQFFVRAPQGGQITLVGIGPCSDKNSQQQYRLQHLQGADAYSLHGYCFAVFGKGAKGKNGAQKHRHGKNDLCQQGKVGKNAVYKKPDSPFLGQQIKFRQGAKGEADCQQADKADQKIGEILACNIPVENLHPTSAPHRADRHLQGYKRPWWGFGGWRNTTPPGLRPWLSPWS